LQKAASFRLRQQLLPAWIIIRIMIFKLRLSTKTFLKV